jgi:hypothetical protein
VSTVSYTQGTWGRPEEGPWWRFVPRTVSTGRLGIAVGVLMIAQCVLSLASGEDSTGVLVLEVVVGALGVAQLVRSIDGLRVPRRREER